MLLYLLAVAALFGLGAAVRTWLLYALRPRRGAHVPRAPRGYTPAERRRRDAGWAWAALLLAGVALLLMGIYL
jgi:hypothetical protein